jgi:hypothetical protein
MLHTGFGLVIQLVVMLALGVACSLIANGRGRSPVGWFFVGFLAGCIGLILVLVLPDLKVEQERQRRLSDENRRLRERLRKDRMVADERHAEVARRIGAHDVALGVDTTSPTAGALPHGASDAPSSAVPDGDAGLRAAQWYYARGLDRQGPIDFASLRELWRDGGLTPETLVWRKGMAKWIAVRDVPSLETTLDA